MKKNWKHISPYITTALVASGTFYGLRQLLRNRQKIGESIAELTDRCMGAISNRRFNVVKWFEQTNENHGQLNFKYKVDLMQNYEFVFGYLRKLENLKDIVPMLSKVEPINGSHSVYRVHTKMLGMYNSFYLFVVKERPNSFLGWSSATDTLFYNTGKFELHPHEDDGGTTMECVISITPPGGNIGMGVAKSLYSLIDDHIAKYVDALSKAIESADQTH